MGTKRRDFIAALGDAVAMPSPHTQERVRCDARPLPAFDRL